MRAETRGIIVTKAELGALLEFAATDPERKLSNIALRVQGDKLKVFASDGRRAVEGLGVATEKTKPGEWAIGREFLAELRKLLTAEDRAILHTSGASLHEATIEDKDGKSRSSLTWPTDAASTQASFGDVVTQAIQIPQSTKRATCVSLSASYLGSVALVAKAAGWDTVDIYAPKSRLDPVVFRVDGHESTWTGCIMPVAGDEEEPE